MNTTKPRARIPESVVAGDIITIRTTLRHRMESGQRKDEQGNLVPRNIINYFEAEFNGERIFAVDIAPAIAANPYFKFTARIDTAGTLTMKWTDDAGEITQLSKDIALVE